LGIASWSPTFTSFLGDELQAHPYNGQEVVLGDIFQAAVENQLIVQGVRFEDGSYLDIGNPEALVAVMEHIAGEQMQSS